MLGVAGAIYHLEFTYSRKHPVPPAPTVEDLAVFYIPAESEWQATCASMLAAGFKQVTAFNPYWELRGRTYEDRDSYRIVLQQAEWRVGVERGHASRPATPQTGAPKRAAPAGRG